MRITPQGGRPKRGSGASASLASF